MSYVKIKDVTAPKMTRKQVKIEADTIAEAAAKLAEAIKEEGIL
jgi:electron transfer flavoprotein alpha/beta subunit